MKSDNNSSDADMTEDSIERALKKIKINPKESTQL